MDSAVFSSVTGESGLRLRRGLRQAGECATASLGNAKPGKSITQLQAGPCCVPNSGKERSFVPRSAMRDPSKPAVGAPSATRSS